MKSSTAKSNSLKPGLPRVGISGCLLGEEIRYDGGHRWHSGIARWIGPRVEWVSLCPETEVGLGVPREPIHMVGDPAQPRLIDSKTGRDWTRAMTEYSRQKIAVMKNLNLDGFIFKRSSPSCGLDAVKVYEDETLGEWTRKGRGIFAHYFVLAFPNLPAVEEEVLSTRNGAKRFLDSVRRYHESRLRRR
ncbi:MAG: DUF523 domain-containing protein [Nitrospinaceae bacterium]